MHDDELTPAEERAFATLPREAQPSDLLEERTVNALAGRGWLHTRRGLPAPLAWAAAAAACLVFFVAGFSMGQSRSESRPTEAPVFAPSEKRTSEPGDTRPGSSTRLTLAGADSTTAEGTQFVVWF